MRENEFYKDPGATLDYMIDWTDWLGTDTIATADWAVGSGLTEVTHANTTTTATLWVSGGTEDASYKCTCTITTAGSKTDKRTIIIHVVPK